MDAPDAVSRRGDNIYRPWAIGEFRQLPSRHSHPDGTENIETKRTDLSCLHVLIGERYVYFGREGPLLPPELAFLKIGRAHRCRFTEEEVAQVAAWFTTLPNGLHGTPAQWPPTETPWSSHEGNLQPKGLRFKRRGLCQSHNA